MIIVRFIGTLDRMLYLVESVGLKETSRKCSNADCHVKLKDIVLDWEVLFIALPNPTLKKQVYFFSHLSFLGAINGTSYYCFDRIAIRNICFGFIIMVRLNAFLHDAFPIEEMNPAEVHCEMADVVLCLGMR
ncbi:hypothetical protein Tco_1232057 [Tanacetum coccineum]